ncbi:MAG: hypothetical protein V2A71_04885 [Candidatus Eisenbacteria bacterium]
MRKAFAMLRRLVRGAASGESLYREGLGRVHSGDCARALEMFEEAALRFRREESVEKLARLRVNQLMVKYRMEASAIEKQRIVEEVVLRLSKLREIESPEPPFGPLDAREVLRRWLEEKTFVIGAGATAPVARSRKATGVELEEALPCELVGATGAKK